MMWDIFFYILKDNSKISLDNLYVIKNENNPFQVIGYSVEEPKLHNYLKTIKCQT